MSGLFVFILGLLFGSFLNVVIYRLPNKLSIVHPRSFCPSCKKPIYFYDNVPILSYVLLRGRCRFCRSFISVRYPIVELITALGLLTLYLKFGFSARFIMYSVLVLFLIPIGFIDWDRKLILNKLTLPGFILGILFTFGFQIESWQNIVFGALGGGGSALVIGFFGKLLLKKESMGLGDVKLLVMTGVYVGFPNVLFCFLFGVFIAAIFIVGGMILRKIRLGDIIPFGPFIAIGTLVFLIYGEAVIHWYIGLL